MKRISLILACLSVAAGANAASFLVSQTPAPNGGTMRWSKLWVDPLGQNDLDGDAICYQDFHATTAITITHMEWWGDHNPNKGFQIEYWKQDPGTIAYQPYAVFRNNGANPESAFTSTDYASEQVSAGLFHFSLDLSNPVSLAANNAVNPRWFVAIIGLTDVPYLEWNWAQGLGGSHNSFQWIRGGNEGGGDVYRVLGDGRAMVLSGTAVPEPATVAVLSLGLAGLIVRRGRVLSRK